MFHLLMSFDENDIFEIEENYVEFQEVCSRLKDHAFPSPWNLFFKKQETSEFIPEVSEFVIEDDMNDLKEDPQRKDQAREQALLLGPNRQTDVNSSDALLDKKKVSNLKDLLVNAEEDNMVEYLKDFDVFFITSSSQIPLLFQMLDASTFSDNAVILLLNAFMQYKDQISIATVTALVHYVICPLVFDLKRNSSRFLLTTILKFAEAYPKSTVDEIMIPYSKQSTSDNIQPEILFQIAKTSLPNEYVSYTIKNVLENAIPIDNTFALLQCLIERKVHHDSVLNDLVLKKLLEWTPACNKNVKFTKLLTSILSAYGNEFTEQQILVCDEAVKSNKTIIKKAAENLLKELKHKNS